MHIADHSTLWVVFVVISIAVAYGLRGVVWWVERRAAEQVDAARRAVGLKRGDAKARPETPG